MFKRTYDMSFFDVRKELHSWVVGKVFEYLMAMGQIDLKNFPKDMFDNMVQHSENAALDYIHNNRGPGGNCSDLACELAIQARKVFGTWQEEDLGQDRPAVNTTLSEVDSRRGDYHNPSYWDESSQGYLRRMIG